MNILIDQFIKKVCEIYVPYINDLVNIRTYIL